MEEEVRERGCSEGGGVGCHDGGFGRAVIVASRCDHSLGHGVDGVDGGKDDQVGSGKGDILEHFRTGGRELSSQ